MKKIFKLTSETKKPERIVDSIKHEVKKYLARERRKKIPESYDCWNFDCRIGANDQDASVIEVSEINAMISKVASDNPESFYLEILAKPGQKPKK